MLLNSRWVEVRDYRCLVLRQRLHYVATADLATIVTSSFASVAISTVEALLNLAELIARGARRLQMCYNRRLDVLSRGSKRPLIRRLRFLCHMKLLLRDMIIARLL